MFKYIKTIHSHTVAETMRRQVSNDMEIPAGTLCQISNGYLVHTSDPSKPYYLVIEDKKPGDNKRMLDCIRLLPGMILRGTYYAEDSNPLIGSMCGYTTDMNEYHTMIGTGTAAEIIDKDSQFLTIIIN